jgi:Tfp pilus assembly protein PilF
MRGWRYGVILILLCGAGCATPGQEKVRAYVEDGVHLYSLNDFADAQDSFRAALAIRPADPDLLYNYGQCCDRLGEDAAAERAYSDCLQRSPTHAECRHALAALLVRENRWADATALVHDWLQREPKQATPIAEDAWLWRVYGDLPRARARVEEALAMDPHDNRALLEKAQIYELMNRPDRAMLLYEQALQYRPDQPDVKGRLTSLRRDGAEHPKPD